MTATECDTPATAARPTVGDFLPHVEYREVVLAEDVAAAQAVPAVPVAAAVKREFARSKAMRMARRPA